MKASKPISQAAAQKLLHVVEMLLDRNGDYTGMKGLAEAAKAAATEAGKSNAKGG